MKASLLVSTGKLELVDLPEPVITDPYHVKIQVKATGICGSEMHAFKGSHPFRKPPAVMGHEIAGIVTEVGNQVTKIKPGDRVFVDPQWVCGKCYACVSGNINLCSSKMVMGIKEWSGGFGELVIAPEETVMHLPSSLNFVEGAMLEPLSVAVHASRIAKIQKEMSVLILGTGSIGSLIAACAKAEGITNLYAVDLHQHCIENAEKFFGVVKGFVLPSDTVENELLDLTKGKGFDVIFICADDPSLLPLSVRLSKLQGKICFLALMTDELLKYDGYAALRKEVSIITSYMGVHTDVVRSLDLVNSRSVDVEKIVTHCLPIASAQLGMELACTKDKNAIKVVLTHNQ